MSRTGRMTYSTPSIEDSLDVMDRDGFTHVIVVPSAFPTVALHTMYDVSNSSVGRVVLPDEGVIDMIKALAVYKEVGYEYMIMPDHVPGLAGPAAREVGFAYTYGYIHAALQAVNAAA